MKTIAVLVVMFGSCIAALEWLHIFYRLELFVSDYGCQRGVNHIGDGQFVLSYVIHGALFLVLALAAWVLWKQPGRWRALACWAGAAHVAACLALFTMHSNGILVEYGEFIRNRASGPNHPAGGNAGSGILFACERAWPGVPQPGRWAKGVL